MWREAALAVALAAPSGQAGAEEATPRDAAFLVEIVCADSGPALLPIVLTETCAAPRLRGARDIVAFQRHDWPSADEARQRPQGYQRSVSYAARDTAGRIAAVQTFDFGGGERRFGRFDQGRGDGGQVATIRRGAAHVAMTEDGSGGVQWFTGSACRGEPEPVRSGWLLFGESRGEGWRSSVAELRTTRTASECPVAFDRSFTRWREAAIDWPVLFDGRRDPARPELPAVRTIVSEHFGGHEGATADHMERFFLANGVGLIRWERWEQVGRSRHAALDERAAGFAASGRCPEVLGSAPPGEAWRRIDCRTWTNFVASAEAADGFAWPQPDGAR